VLYKSDNTCQSFGDYDQREYFFIVTNTDGDSIIETTDRDGKWQSGLVGDGNYWVFVRASDVFGNTTTDSMQVTTNNGVAVAERVQPVLSLPLSVSPAVGTGDFSVSFGLASEAGASLRVLDPLGRVVSTLAHGRLGRGAHSYRPAADGSRLGGGVYLVELALGNGDAYTRKLVVVGR
jgi:hypothetical protein